MKHSKTFICIVFWALQLLPSAVRAAVIDAKWVPAEADYVISFDLEQLRQQPPIREMQKSIDEGVAMAALNRQLRLPEADFTAAMFVGGERMLRGLLIQLKVSDKQLDALLMKQRGVRVENVEGLMFYLLPPLSQEKPLDQEIAIARFAPGLLFVTFEKYAAFYLKALKRGKHPAFQSRIALPKAPVWVLIELQKISDEELRRKGKKAARSNVYLQLGSSIHRIWGAFLPADGKAEWGRISLEAVCRDDETARQSVFPLQMVAAIGVNAIMPEDPDTAAKITERMRPRLVGCSCLIEMEVDQTLWHSVGSSLAKQYRGEPQPVVRRKRAPSSTQRRDPKR